jgi:RIMS-binding protein 2
MVSEIDLDDSETESHVSTGTFVSSPTKKTPPISTPTSSKSLKKMIATFDYNPNANSPNKNHNDELSFHSGDIIYIHGNIRDDGFYSGELVNGKKGLVPSNYVKEISEENEKKVS